MIDSIKTFNSLVRTLLAAALVAMLAVAGWWGYLLVNADDFAREELADVQSQLAAKAREAADAQAELAARSKEIAAARSQLEEQKRQIGALEQDVAEKLREIAKKDAALLAQQQEIDRLDTALALIKVDRRLAQVTVLNQGEDPETGEPYTTVKFVELNDEGRPIGKPRIATLPGEMVHVDAWIIKFDDKHVEQADLHRSTSICLFRSLYGEVDGQVTRVPLDEVGARPLAYGRGGRISEYEQNLWDNFWQLANDAEKAQDEGVRAAHGQVVYIKAQAGKTYSLKLRASDGLTISPPDKPSGEPTL